MEVLFRIYALIAMVRMHPFWNRAFWRAFGVWGVAIAVTCLLGAVIATETPAHSNGFGSYLGWTAIWFLPAPMLALPLCACIRLYPVLFSSQWRTVIDWAITHLVGIIMLIAGLVVSERISDYLLFGAAVILCVFPVLAFERIYGKLKPE
jgi:hypothetical protein